MVALDGVASFATHPFNGQRALETQVGTQAAEKCAISMIPRQGAAGPKIGAPVAMTVIGSALGGEVRMHFLVDETSVDMRVEPIAVWACEFVKSASFSASSVRVIA